MGIPIFFVFKALRVVAPALVTMHIVLIPLVISTTATMSQLFPTGTLSGHCYVWHV